MFVDSGRKPLEMIAELLTATALARVDIVQTDKKFTFTVYSSQQGQMRVWPVADSVGEILTAKKTTPVIQYIGKSGVKLLLVYRRENFIEIEHAVVTAAQTHFDKLVAAQRRKNQIVKEQKIAAAALNTVKNELILLTDFEQSAIAAEREIWLESSTRRDTLNPFLSWCDAENSRLTSLIDSLTANGLPGSGLGRVENVMEQFVYFDDVYPLRVGMINAGYTISTIRLNVGDVPFNQPLHVLLGALIVANFSAAEMADIAGSHMTLELNYAVRTSADLTINSNGATRGAAKLLISTYKTGKSR